MQAKKRFFAVMAAIATVFCLTLSCTVFGAEKIKLTMGTWGSETFWGFHEKAIADFEALNPDIEVELLKMGGGGANYWERLVTLQAAGQMPDIFRVVSSQQTDVYRSGMALELTPFINNDPAFSRDFILPPMGIGDKAYAIADGIIVNIIHLNEEKLAERGLVSPTALYKQGIWDYDALADTARKVTQLNADDQVVSVGFAMVTPALITVGPWVQSFGGSWFGPENNTVMFNRPEAIAGLAWLRDRFLEKSFSDRNPQDVRAMMADGKWGMAFNWSLPKVEDVQYGNVKTEYVPWPKGPVQDVTTFRTEPWAIASTSNNKEAAYKLARFMAAQGYIYQVQEAGKVPNYKPLMKELVAHADRFVGGVDYLNEQLNKLTPQPVPPSESQVMAILNPTLTAIIKGEVSIENVLESIAGPIQNILDGK
ncbi:MAG TPA: extracellular solute-binding protein [Firmicutes bacterium]|jgi:ABC-type glycerol-3-phosphate transport system substrate-binding protein|nr:extracellular solute-binding protein [Bacillota bacterium]